MVRYALIAIQRDGRSVMEVVDLFDDGNRAWREARKLTRAHRGRMVYTVRPVKESITEKVMGSRFSGGSARSRLEWGSMAVTTCQEGIRR